MDAYSTLQQAMIDRAGSMTADEVRALGDLWESTEEIVYPPLGLSLEIQGEVDYPVVSNEALVAAWEHALDAAGTGGRVDEIEAAREAGRAAVRDVRHLHDTPAEKNGAEEAVRSAVLAVGVRDLISADEYEVLVTPWRHVLGMA